MGSSIWVLLVLAVLASASLLAFPPATSPGGAPKAGSGPLSAATGPAIAVTPLQGPTGTPFNVEGSDFTPSSVANVTFNGTVLPPTACSVGTFSGTNIMTDPSGSFSCNFTVPSVHPGTYNVTGNDTTTSTLTSPVVFTVTSLEITVTPKQGPVGSSFTVKGSGFTVSSEANVTFDSAVQTPSACTAGVVKGTNIVSNSTGGFKCTFSAPSESPGSYNVVGIDNATSNLSNAVSFTVTSVSITVTPGQGPVGAPVTVAGTGFSVSKALSSLTFGGATILSSNCTTGSLTANATGVFHCTFAVPGGTSGSLVKATDKGGQTASGTFTVTIPAITVSPHQGAVGNSFSVVATGFTVSSKANVTFGTTVLTPTACSVGTFASTAITTNLTGAFTCTFDVPTVSPGAYNVFGTDKTTATRTNMVSFTVTPLSITVTPGQGPVKAPVTVAGTGFAVNTALTSLIFDNVTIGGCSLGGSLTTGSSGSFSCEFYVPAGTSGTTVTATDIGGQTAQGSFTVTTPAITVAPTQGPVGSTFTVVGSGFTVNSGAALAFNGVDLEPTGCATGTASGTTITTVSNGAFSCTFSVPSVANPESYNVVGLDLTTSTSTNTVSFSVTRPSITVAPGQGPVGATVTVSGTGFSVSTPLASLSFDGVTITSCTTGSTSPGSSGAFSCAFTVPIGTSGTTVSASDAGGRTATAAFTVTSPAIAVTPGQGPIGASVAVIGTGFSVAPSLAALVFDGVVIKNCTSGSLATNGTGAFTCRFVVPSETSGTTLTATDAGGQTATASFEVTPLAISVSPGQGPMGAMVTVNGTGFSVPTQVVTLWFDGVEVYTCASGSLFTNSSGAFSCTFEIPGDTSGTSVTATDVGGQSTAASFTVTTPRISVTPVQGLVGSAVTVTGTGFSVSTPLASLVFDGRGISNCPRGGSLTTGSSGVFSCSFLVPGATVGSTVTATDAGGLNATEPFLVLTPAVTMSPAKGTVGSSVAMTGAGFNGLTAYSVLWDSETILCSGKTNATGGFACSYTVPVSAAGAQLISVSQGIASFDTNFSVVPSLAFSVSNGTVGTAVTVSGLGFDADMPYTVSWNATVALCAGTTSASGELTCTFTIPQSAPGKYSITASEGSYAPTFSFSVTKSPSSTSAAFPWWIVGVIAIAILVVLVVVLVFSYRRSHRRGLPAPSAPRPGEGIHPWESALPATGGGTSLDAAPAMAIPAVGVAEAAPEEPEPNIDEMMVRLERMSVQMFKKTPKELGQEDSTGESAGSSDEPVESSDGSTQTDGKTPESSDESGSSSGEPTESSEEK